MNERRSSARVHIYLDERAPESQAPTAAAIDIQVGQRIRRRREALGVTQGALARHLGVTFSQVQKYEKGANRIGAGRLHLVATFLALPVQSFFEGVLTPPAGSGDRSCGDLAALQEAFLSIADTETRASVVALVCSLAERVGAPRRTPAPTGP